jgi:hypothetical protein
MFSQPDLKKLNSNLSIDQLKNIKYKNFDVGYAILSSVVSIYRDPYLTVQKYFDLFQHYYQYSIQLYEFFIGSLKVIRPDIVIILMGDLPTLEH